MRILTVARREDGAIAVMVAILAVALIVVAAFTTDFGMAYAQRRALSTGADSAALAVIHTEYNTQLAFLTRTCADALAQDAALDPADPSKASNIAYTQINANAPFGATIPASDIVTTLSCVSSGTVLQVRVTVNRTIQPILGGAASASPMHIKGEAVAALGVINGVTGLMPIAVCTNEAQAIIAQHVADKAAGRADGAQLVPLDKVWGSGASCDGGGGTGNWGWLNFGKGVSVPDLVAYITGAYPFTLTLPVPPIDGTPGDKGNSNNVVDAMQTVMDKIVNLPVYSTVSGNGANTEYSIIGFLSVKLCGFRSNSKQTVGTCYNTTTPGVQLVKNDMQVRYVDYTPVGQIGEVCLIGSSCASNTYVTKLLG